MYCKTDFCRFFRKELGHVTNMHCAEGHGSRKAENDDLLCIPAIAKSQREQTESSSEPLQQRWICNIKCLSTCFCMFRFLAALLSKQTCQKIWTVKLRHTLLKDSQSILPRQPCGNDQQSTSSANTQTQLLREHLNMTVKTPTTPFHSMCTYGYMCSLSLCTEM